MHTISLPCIATTQMLVFAHLSLAIPPESQLLQGLRPPTTKVPGNCVRGAANVLSWSLLQTLRGFKGEEQKQYRTLSYPVLKICHFYSTQSRKCAPGGAGNGHGKSLLCASSLLGHAIHSLNLQAFGMHLRSSTSCLRLAKEESKQRAPAFKTDRTK